MNWDVFNVINPDKIGSIEDLCLKMFCNVYWQKAIDERVGCFLRVYTM
ncbi:MAG: hypothetical protein R3Y24_17505 [Eubacteriales bacterium]